MGRFDNNDNSYGNNSSNSHNNREDMLREMNATYEQLMVEYGVNKLTKEVKDSMLLNAKKEKEKENNK